MKLYRRCAPIIKHGTSRRHGRLGDSWRRPRGWQAVVRTSLDGKGALLVLHTFAEAPERVTVPLPEGPWRAAMRWGACQAPEAVFSGGRLTLHLEGDFTGSVLLMAQ